MTLLLQVKEQPQTRKSGATKGSGKKRNHKKKGARKQCELQTDETLSNCDNDTVYEAPPVGEWQQCNRAVLEIDDGSAELNEVDAGYEKYWAEQGEYLVWEGWIGKYPDYLSQVGVNDGIPAVREVEICSENIGDISEPNVECHQSEYVDRTDNIKEMESRHMTDVPPQDGCDDMKKAPFDKLKCPTAAFNNAVTSRMARVMEADTGDNSDVSSGESNAGLVHEMHDYALARVGDELQGGTCQYELETNDDICRTVSETSGDIWEALWTEHYAETYWYYYNQYRQWFGGSDQLLTDMQQLPVYTACLLPSGDESKQHINIEDALVEANTADDESLLDAISSKCSITNDDCCDQMENSGFKHAQNCHVMSKRTDDEEVEETPASMETDRCCDAEAGDKERSHEEVEQSDGSGQKRRRKQKSRSSDGSGRFMCYPCTDFCYTQF